MSNIRKTTEALLFQPVGINTMKLRNRFVRSSTYEGLGTVEGRPTAGLRKVYYRLAEGNIGLIVTGAVNIDPYRNIPITRGNAFPVTIENCSYKAEWNEIITGVHKRGAKIAVQLAHLGRQDHPLLRPDGPIGPSAVPIVKKKIVPREMDIKEIKDHIHKFSDHCLYAKKMGFDAVQLNGAHGNLINNFFSPLTNLRSDEYGGSIKNRTRFAIEIIRQARELVGEGFPIMIKMNFADMTEGGLECDEALEMACLLVEAGVDSIEVSGGTLSESKEKIAVPYIKYEYQEAYFSCYAKKLKQYVDVPVILVGGIRSLRTGIRLINNQVTDLIALCRPLVREPQLVGRWSDGNEVKAECISCNKCWIGWFVNPLKCYQ